MKDAEETDTAHFYEIAHDVKEVTKSSIIQEETDTFNGDVINNKTETEVIRRSVVPDTSNTEFEVVEDVEDIQCTNEVGKQEQEDDEEGCMHHDMVDSGYNMSQETDHIKVLSREQCSHSDAVKLGKAVKVNRVSPFRYGDIDAGNLLIDLTESEIEDYKRIQLHSEKSITLKSKEEEDGVNCNGYSDDLNISQERFSTDLPRHNWLVKRLKQQNQLNEGDIVSLHASVSDGSEMKQEGKKTEVHTSGTESVPQVMITSPSSPRNGYDVPSKSSYNNVTSANIHESIRPLSPLSINRLSPTTKNEDILTSSSPTKNASQASSFPSPKSYATNSGATTPRSQFINNYMSSSSLSSSSSSPTKHVTVVGLKPKLVMSTTQQPVSSPKDYPPTLPGIDLSTLKYDSLSRFNSSPKQAIQSQFYPTISSSYSLPQYGEGRTIREVTRPVPLHLKESYKSEQDAFGLNHRVRLSFTPLSATKDKPTFHSQNIDKSSSMLKSYDTPYPTTNNPTSPEEMKRTVAIQRQLENQKRWIAEHEPYKINATNNPNKYGERSEGHSNQTATSPLNPTNVPPSQRYPPRVTEEGYNLDHLSILQSREHLRDKIDACNKEIKNIQQQKDVLFARQQGIPNNDSPTHLRIIALNRKLSSLEDYRMKQSALLMKLEAQPFDQLTRDQLTRDHRSQVAMATRKPGYTDVNGASSEVEEAQPKRINFSDQSDNLLLRQLQSKHDEGVSMVTTDSYCRTIDLSKTSEMFYNEMRMESLPMSQPSTPMSNPALKDYPHTGDIPPLVSAERLSTNGLPQEKPSVTSGDFPRGHSLPYSKSPDIPRPVNLTHSSRISDNQASHELAHSIQRDISMSRDQQSRYSQYERLARARELQHSLQLQDAAARASSHDITQIQDRLSLRSRSLNPQELSNGRAETTNQTELSKTRDMSSYSHLSGSTSDPTQNPYSPVSASHSQSYPDATYDDVRSKDIAMKRHSNDPARPGQLKLARTVPSMMHQIHASQMDRKFPKVLQHNTIENKYSPSNMPSMLGEDSPYKRTNRYEMVTSSQAAAQMNDYEGGGRTSYPPEKQKLRIRTCNACDKESQFLCSGCRGIWYCSRECQLDDWKVHSKNCRKK